MKLLYKDQLRKIKNNLFNFISLSILVIIISLTFTAVKSSIRRLEENYDVYLEQQNVEDFYFAMDIIDVNHLGGTAIVKICDELDIMQECGVAFAHPGDPIYTNNLNIIINEKIEEHPELYETIIGGYVQEFADEYDFNIEKSYIANINDGDYLYKFMSITSEIDIPYIVEGRLPVNDFEISIFPEFAELNEIQLGDSYTIDNKEYIVVGFHYQPEYLFPIFSMSTIAFDPQVQTLVLTNKNTLDDLDQFLFTKYLVDGDLSVIFEDFGYDTIQSNDFSFLGKQMQLVYILMPKEINFRIIALPTEITNANAFINIFLPLFISFVTLLLIVFMKRYIDKNEKDIKTLHALGYTKGEIARSILLYPFLVSITSVIGFIGGVIASDKLFNLYSSRYLFPKAGFTIDWDLFLLTVVLPIVLITGLNYIFIIINLNKKKKSIKKFKLRLFKFTPTKTVLTTFMLFITIGIMVTFGLNGNSMFTSFVDYTKKGNNYSEMINLQYMTNTDHFDTYEEYSRMSSKIKEVNSRTLKMEKSTTIYGIDSDNSLKLLIDNKIDNNLLLEDGVIISDYLKESLDLKIGDTITFEVGGVISTEEIVGISNELIENNFFILKSKMNEFFGLDNTYYNGLYITDNLYDSEFITSRIDYQNSLDEFTAVLNVSSLILNFLLVLSIVLSLFVFTLMIISYFTDNRINIAILKSIGYNNLEINKKYLLVLYLILLIAYVASVPITSVLLNYMLRILMDNIGFKLIVKIKLVNVIMGFVVLNALFGVIVFYANKYYSTITISEVIKHNIK